MNYLTILNPKEHKKIENRLKKQFGIKKINGILVKKGKEKIFLFAGGFNKKDIKKLESEIIIERVGIYFAKENFREIRLSLEGVQILKKQITKNIFELTKEQAISWMQGNELNIKTGEKTFLIMKYQEDYLGCGKASEEKIGNYISKSRRLKQ